MEDFQYILEHYGRAVLSATVSINDLKEMESEGRDLSPEELKAVFNYDKYCLEELNKKMSEEKFHLTFNLLSVMANMRPYKDFLDEKYSR